MHAFEIVPNDLRVFVFIITNVNDLNEVLFMTMQMMHINNFYDYFYCQVYIKTSNTIILINKTITRSVNILMPIPMR